MKMKQIPIEELEGYFATEDGQIISKCYPHREKPMTQQPHYKGYKVVRMRNKTYKVHRLIAITFLERDENREQVDHINRIKTDNRVENLRWANRSENIRNRLKATLRCPTCKHMCRKIY